MRALAIVLVSANLYAWIKYPNWFDTNLAILRSKDDVIEAAPQKPEEPPTPPDFDARMFTGESRTDDVLALAGFNSVVHEFSIQRKVKMWWLHVETWREGKRTDDHRLTGSGSTPLRLIFMPVAQDEPGKWKYRFGLRSRSGTNSGKGPTTGGPQLAFMKIEGSLPLDEQDRESISRLQFSSAATIDKVADCEDIGLIAFSSTFFELSHAPPPGEEGAVALVVKLQLEFDPVPAIAPATAK